MTISERSGDKVVFLVFAKEMGAGFGLVGLGSSEGVEVILTVEDIGDVLAEIFIFGKEVLE